MTEEYWVAVLKEEDRLLSNSDRKYRYHCNSLESMSEELTFQERCFYIQEDFTVQCEIRDFIDTIQNETGSGKSLSFIFGKDINVKRLQRCLVVVRRR